MTLINELPQTNIKAVNGLLYSLLKEKIAQMRKDMTAIVGFVGIDVSPKNISIYATNDDIKNDILYRILPFYVGKTIIDQECEYVKRPYITVSQLQHICRSYEMKRALERSMLSSAFRGRCGCRINESHCRFIIFCLDQEEVVDWLYEVMGIDYQIVDS